MLKDYILGLCQDQYENSCAGNCGRYCDNRQYCKGDCDAHDGCLDQVHWYPRKNGRADYNCEHLIQKYMLNFTERYEEQIFTALQTIDTFGFDKYNILSLGCGGAPDLMAFEEVANETGKQIHYSGYDRNPKWKSIHNAIMDYVSVHRLGDAEISQTDIFDVLESQNFSDKQYNFVIIQYMLSHLYNTGQSCKINELFDKLIESVLPLRYPKSPFAIIICDIDSMNKGRSTWYSLLDKLEQNGYYGKAIARSYYPNGDLGAERWSRFKDSPLFGNIEYHYTPNISDHDGAQLIIELE